MEFAGYIAIAVATWTVVVYLLGKAVGMAKAPRRTP